MSPKEMAQIATSKAKADLCNELERLEFIYERPVHIIDDELIESFVMLCIGNLIKYFSVTNWNILACRLLIHLLITDETVFLIRL